ncbi:MAG: hypothetical protein ACKO8Z_11810 [Prosthecobacter sp.]
MSVLKVLHMDAWKVICFLNSLVSHVVSKVLVGTAPGYLFLVLKAAPSGTTVIAGNISVMN